MWVKICANTTLEDAQLAANAGADAVGFVFAPSPRRVTPQHVREIALRLPAAIEKIGVFVDAGFDEIAEIVSTCGLTGVQLHGTSDFKLSENLRAHFNSSQPALRIIRTLHFDLSEQASAASAAAQSSHPELGFASSFRNLASDPALDAVLLDSRTATASGGTGLAFDWAAARASFACSGQPLRIIVAGGLDPLNVREAIHTLHPWGVDVATGVEASPGKKDRAKVIAFVQAARSGAAQSGAARSGAAGTEAADPAV